MFLLLFIFSNMQDSFENGNFTSFLVFVFNFNRHFFTFWASRSHYICFVTGHLQ